MSPQQQAALEQLLGRGLEQSELAALDPLLDAENRQDVQIAEFLSSLRPPRFVSRAVGIGTVLAALAPNGGEFLNALELLSSADANVKWALRLIEQGNLDVGLQVTRSELLAFVDQNPALADGINALLAMAEVPDVMNFNLVSGALNIAEGRQTFGGAA